MAKEQQDSEQQDETNAEQQGSELQDETNAEQQDEVKAETQDETAENTSDVLVEAVRGFTLVPLAGTLRAIHPQASYGRCGYRFNKESAVEIPVENLTGEQVIMLAEDPWLELIPICDK